MNEVIKLAVAFTTGVVVTFLFLGFINKAEAPTVTPSTNNATSSDESDNDADSESAEQTTQTETQTQPAQQQTYTPPPQQNTPPQNTQPEPEPQLPYAATVSFTGSRFIPDEALVIKGGRVTFMNNSDDQEMWIASNFHPYHNAYPETSESDCNGSTFDQCASVEPGGSWTFTFNEEGKWFYHEENKPVVTGEIRVLSVEDYEKEF